MQAQTPAYAANTSSVRAQKEPEVFRLYSRIENGRLAQKTIALIPRLMGTSNRT
jgi:hypothetical protein